MTIVVVVGIKNLIVAGAVAFAMLRAVAVVVVADADAILALDVFVRYDCDWC